MENNRNTTLHIPAVALRGLTILPDTIIHFDLSRRKSIEAVEQSMMESQRIFLITQKDSDAEDPNIDQLYHIGTLAVVKQVTKLPNQIVRVLVEGEKRAILNEIDEEITSYVCATVETLEETAEVTDHAIVTMDGSEDVEIVAQIRELQELLESYIRFHPKIAKSLHQQFENAGNLAKLIDNLAANLPLNYTVKQNVLELVDISQRYDYFAGVLYNEIEIAKIKTNLAENIKAKVEKNQKEYILREQLGYIREELGDDHSFSDAEQFQEDLKKLKASKEVKEKIRKEISRFKSIGGNSSESSMQRGFLETLLELPWDKTSSDKMDITRAEQILNEDHYGLDKVKERILDFLAVRSLTSDGESPILCLVGPPGTGKTSIAHSVANALNKKYVRVSLGGVRDEAEIRGHRKTYVGAMPGRIVNGLRSAGVKNPLFLLDEIDKMSSDYKGDTASALLEVLDSEQNSRFRDHYVEIPVDLSQVLFIATANSTETIPRPLLDRMELIEINSYTANEKFHIAKQFLVKKEMKKNGLADKNVTISDNALKSIIQYYTREAGVRELERKIDEICRKSARRILQEKVDGIKVTSGNLEKYLGIKKYLLDKANTEDQIGIVRGLAWTSVGGETLQIEVNVMPGKGDLELTGQLGDVMKESAIAGLSFIRSISEQYGIPGSFYQENDIHIHIPEGAVPKDGPSAGITMAIALLSAITETPVKASVAMTGEITLRGRVLPIGGLKEKILAAKTAGIQTLLIPVENEKDMEEIPQEIKSGINFIFIENMRDAIPYAFQDGMIKTGKSGKTTKKERK
ncbi:MAG: endopeptidase La [Lachnospiraceae bacterium]|nr:endopeptidase La [Lachnospiraceae bacterium]